MRTSGGKISPIDMSLRRQLRGLKDRELAHLDSQAETYGWTANRKYLKEGGVSPEFAEQVADVLTMGTVARAVARERSLHGGHNDLTGDLRAGPKRENRLFGRLLRENRGVER